MDNKCFLPISEMSDTFAVAGYCASCPWFFCCINVQIIGGRGICAVVASKNRKWNVETDWLSLPCLSPWFRNGGGWQTAYNGWEQKAHIAAESLEGGGGGTAPLLVSFWLFFRYINRIFQVVSPSLCDLWHLASPSCVGSFGKHTAEKTGSLFLFSSSMGGVPLCRYVVFIRQQQFVTKENTTATTEKKKNVKRNTRNMKTLQNGASVPSKSRLQIHWIVSNTFYTIGPDWQSITKQLDVPIKAAVLIPV